MYRAFWHRHRPVWEFIELNDRNFWLDVRETQELIYRMRWTTEGAVVSEPNEASETRAATRTENGTQTNAAPVSRRDNAAQTEAVTSVDVAVQTATVEVPSPSESPCDETESPEFIARETLAIRARTVPHRMRGPNGCWNCLSPLHVYSRCDLPKMREFCFGCGEQNTTLRNCRNCASSYCRTRPYAAPRGPRVRLPGNPEIVVTEDDLWPWQEKSMSGPVRRSSPPS